MPVADTTYVREREGVLYIGDTRVTMSSLIAAWQNEGYTAEELRLGFPTLSLAQVYGAIAYYLDHQAELDTQFEADDAQYWQQRTLDREADPPFYQRFEERKARLHQQASASPDRPDGNGAHS